MDFIKEFLKEYEKDITHEVMVFVGAAVVTVGVVTFLNVFILSLPFIHLIVCCLAYGYSLNFDRQRYPTVTDVPTKTYQVRLGTNVLLFFIALTLTKVISIALFPGSLLPPISYVTAMLGVGMLFAVLRSVNFLFILVSRI